MAACHRSVIKIQDPSRPPRIHSPKIDQNDWSRYQHLIKAWHAQGFQRPAIRKLLKEAGLTASDAQLARQMHSWGLGDNRSRERFEPRSDEPDNLVLAPSSGCNLSLTDSENTAELLSFQEAIRQQEQASSYASRQMLLRLQESHSRGAYKIGTVFAIVDGGQPLGHSYKCNLFIVAEMPSGADHCFTIRIKSWGGRGIEAYQYQPGFDVGAFAVVYAVKDGQGAPYTTPREPLMVNEALAINLRDNIDLSTLDPMSRACYVGFDRHFFGSSAVLVGELSTFAKELLAIHVGRLTPFGN